MTVGLKDLLPPLATLVSVIAGFGGVVWSLRAARQNQESKRAFDAYDAYLALCFEYPKLANGQLVNQGFSLPDRYEDGSDEFYKYEWFVARLLVAAEQILSAVPKDKEWKDTIWSQVRKHSEYIQQPYFARRIQIYSDPLRSIICDVKTKYPSKSTQEPK
jgi:hypothetical protein